MKIRDIEKIIVLGAGGTGSILLPQLARYLLSKKYFGDLIIADGDSYTEDNIARQTFSLQYVGTNKAEYQAMALASQLPEMEKQLEFIPEYLSKAKLQKLITDGTIVFNCVDNLAARKYVEDKCLKLKNAVHICCGNELRSGQVQINYRKGGKQITPSIYKQSPEFNSNDDDRATLSCEQVAALPSGGQVIVANMMAATLALGKFIQITTEEVPFNNGEWIPSGSVFFDMGVDTLESRDLNELEIAL